MRRYRRQQRGALIFLTACVILSLAGTLAPAFGQPTTEPAGEAAGAGRLTREQEKPAAHLCAGCLAPMFTDGSKGSITPYGRVELDAIYSNRLNNPLDPGQFNGYATAAGSSNNSSTTLNPRYSVFGIRAERTDGVHTLTGPVWGAAGFTWLQDVMARNLEYWRAATGGVILILVLTRWQLSR